MAEAAVTGTLLTAHQTDLPLGIRGALVHFKKKLMAGLLRAQELELRAGRRSSIAVAPKVDKQRLSRFARARVDEIESHMDGGSSDDEEVTQKSEELAQYVS